MCDQQFSSKWQREQEGQEGQEDWLVHGHGHTVGVGGKRRDDMGVTAFRGSQPSGVQAVGCPGVCELLWNPGGSWTLVSEIQGG